MGFYGSLSRYEEKSAPTYDLKKNALLKAFRRMIFQDFHFLEAARIQSGLYEGAYLRVDDFSTKSSFKDLVVENPHGVVSFSPFVNRAQTKGEQDGSSSEDDFDMLFEAQETKNSQDIDVRTKRFVTRMTLWPPFDIWARWILRSRAFEVLMIAVIIVSSVLICLEGELPESETTRILTSVIESLDFLFLLMFIMEIALKWTDNFKEFWNDYWNWFDVIVTSASLFAPFFDLLFPESNEQDNLETIVNTIKYVRIARILRTLNVVTRIHKIMVIWGAITRTFKALIFITILMLIFFYIFAIIGIQLADRFTSTHIINLRYVNRFSQLPYACLTLFQIFTIDHWYPILKELMGVLGGEIACFYILTWLLLGTFIFKNIFAGVMVNNFQNIRQELVDEANEMSNKARLAAGDYDILEIENLEAAILGNRSQGNEWEVKIFHHLDLIKACTGGLSPSLWPRDTLFQYYVILEAYASNVAERDQLIFLLNAGTAIRLLIALLASIPRTLMLLTQIN